MCFQVKLSAQQYHVNRLTHKNKRWAVARDNLHQHALTDWIMLDLGSILYAISKTVFVFALGPLKTKELSFWPMCHF